MAARFDGASDVLSRSASGLGSSSVTLCAWVYIDVDRNDYTSFIGADDGSANWFVLTLDGAANVGATLSASTSGGGYIDGLTLSTGGWYFAAMVSDASGTDWLYWAAAGAGSLSSASGSFTTGINNAWTFRVGNNGFGEWLNGRVAYARAWTAALSSAELLAERASATAVRTSDLWADWPLALNGNDASGNGRHLTAGGTVTYVAGPPAAVSGAASATTGPWVGAAEGSADGPAPSASGTTGPWVGALAGTVGQAGSASATTGPWTAQVLVSSARFPVAVSSSGRYLVDQHGDPWLAVGDTAWSIVGALDDDDIELYLDNRAAKGVNLVLCSIPEPYYVADPPRNADGALPFTGTAFQSALNDAYWDRVDLLVELAAERGITLLVCPFYLGYVDGGSGDGSGVDGWNQAIVAASNAQMRTYAGYLHDRYGDAPNIMWLIGHDRIPGSTLQARAAAFIDELRNELGNTQLFAYGGWHARDLNGTDTYGRGAEDWGTVATTHPPDFDTDYDYSEHNTVVAYTLLGEVSVPLLGFEFKYEQEWDLGIGDIRLRRALWAPFAAGCFGSIFGNNPIWNFTYNAYFGYTGTWEQNLDYAGSQHLAAFASITARLNGWEATAADTTSTFVTNQGTGANRVAARFSGDLGLVYHPNFTTGSISLDLTEFDEWESVVVARIDPVSGARTVIASSEPTTNSSYSISAPSANSVSDRDWLFVITPAPAADATTPPWVATAAGAVGISATATGTTGVWSATLSGTVGQSGTGTATTGTWTAQAVGATGGTVTGTASATSDPWTATATGAVVDHVTGEASGTTGPWAAAMVGIRATTGTATGTTGVWSATLSGTVGQSGTGTATTPPWVATATADYNSGTTVKLGTLTVEDIALGAQPVTALYLGGVRIWS